MKKAHVTIAELRHELALLQTEKDLNDRGRGALQRATHDQYSSQQAKPAVIPFAQGARAQSMPRRGLLGRGASTEFEPRDVEDGVMSTTRELLDFIHSLDTGLLDAQFRGTRSSG
jgi:hypothetical protein